MSGISYGNVAIGNADSLIVCDRGKTNFFEKRVGDYQKAGVMAGLAQDGMHNLSFDEDF